MDIDEIGAWFACILFLGLVVFTGALILSPLYWGYVEYHFNQSDCSVWVDSKMVYDGKCHFVDVSPVGEYGNSKRVAIYSDVRKWHQSQKYISEDVEIKESVK